MSQEQQQQEQQQQQYIFNRDFKGSNRLNLNHWLFKGLAGYLLHPKVQYSHNARIADIGTGTAIWLQELAETLPAPAQLVGFDSSPEQFPPPAWRMPNVALLAHDCIRDPFPAEHRGAYDVVAIRFFRCVVEANDPGPLLRNALSLLKPGGYLQWFDVLGAQSALRTSGPDAPSHASEVLKDMSIHSKQGNFPADWIDELPATVAAHGMDVVVEERIRMRDPYRLVWGQSMLAGIDETTVASTKRKQAAEAAAAVAAGGAAKSEQETRAELDAAVARAHAFIDELARDMARGALVEPPVLCLVAKKR